MDTTPATTSPATTTSSAAAIRKEAHKFHDLEAYLRKEIRRFDLRHREQTIADIILQCSYGYGRMSVVIPKLQIFVDMTGMTVGNVHTTLKNLHSMEIITVDNTRRQVEYSINPNPAKWKCRERTPRLVVHQALQYIKMANGIGEVENATVSSEMKEASGSPYDGGDAIPDPETDANFKNRLDTQFLPGVFPDLDNLPTQGNRPFPLLT